MGSFFIKKIILTNALEVFFYCSFTFTNVAITDINETNEDLSAIYNLARFSQKQQ